MASGFDAAVETLHRAPLQQFIEERKRLAAELKAAGDRDGAARLARLARPPISAWAVNQLYWQARAELDAMFDSAARLRNGDLDATAAHRDAIAALRARAGELLTEAGHATNESTLRRVTATLSALAAAGGFDPDPPGALSADRDPPGFAGVGVADMAAAPPRPRAAPAAHATRAASAAPATDDLAAARRRAEDERTRKKIARARLADARKSAALEVHVREREVAALHKQLAAAEEAAQQARAAVADIDAELAQLDRDR